MNSTNLTLIAVLFVLLGNGSVNSTQLLLLLALLSTSLNGGCGCLFGNNANS